MGYKVVRECYMHTDRRNRARVMASHGLVWLLSADSTGSAACRMVHGHGFMQTCTDQQEAMSDHVSFGFGVPLSLASLTPDASTLTHKRR